MGVFSQPISVAVEDVKAHLILMSAFHRIHQRVEKSGVQLNPTTGLPIPTSTAVVFLGRALQRFELWVTTLDQKTKAPGLKDHEIPPLDVLMCLHAYMLSPLDFYEDSITRHKALARMGEFPLQKIVQLIDQETLELRPTVGQIAYWERTTSEPFEIPFEGPASKNFTVICPRCEADVAVPWTDVTVVNIPSQLFDPGNFPTIVFQATCATCQLEINPRVLGAGRFLYDVYGSCVTGTLINHSGAFPDFAVSKQMSLRMIHTLGQAVTKNTAGDIYGWDMERIIEFLTSGIDQTGSLQRKFSGIFQAYRHPNDFAIDLSKAVFRQARFIFQMSAMGWLDANRFDDKNSVLLLAMRHYEQFLLIETGGLIARWDIDLIWHTHQLAGSRYRSDTLRILGRILDHDDTQPQDAIVEATNNADAVWKAQFGQSYLVPDDPELISSLAKTICGGVGGGACVNSGGSGGGNSGENKGGGSGGNSRSTGLKEFMNLAVLAH